MRALWLLLVVGLLAGCAQSNTSGYETSGHARYIPAPEPAETSPYEIGCYYYPGWKQYANWEVLDRFPERKPLLGYYREGDPEVMDWHIKWAREHGISFWVFDWYWDRGARQLEHALHDGFFNARYQDQMQFCLLWANHNPKGSASEEDLLKVTDFWIEQYFHRKNYYKVDGKPVIVIFSTYRLYEDIGRDALPEAFRKVQEKMQAAGFPGLHFVGCERPGVHIEDRKREGYEALSGYNYPRAGMTDNSILSAPYADMVRGYKEIFDQFGALDILPYYPVCDPGWDSRPWHGEKALVRTDRTVEGFKQMLLNAREHVDRYPPSHGRKIVLIEAWNEWGEGEYIEPNAGNGFRHLDAIREVFARAPEPHQDIVPAEVGLGPYAMERPPDVTSWQFHEESDAADWRGQNASPLRVEDKALVFESRGDDAAVYSPSTRMDAAKFKQCRLVMRVDKGKGAQIFWRTDSGGFSEENSLRFETHPDGRWHEYVLDLRTSPAWKGVIRQVRLDACTLGDASIGIRSLRFQP